MNLRLAILLASLAANVLLAAILVHDHASVPLPTVNSAQVTANSADSPAKFREGKRLPEPASSASPTESEPTSQKFYWSQLESDDYKKYIAALRAFGVPERTIRDIIIADVRKLYRPKFAALRAPKKTAIPNFWETRNLGFNPNSGMTKEQREQMRVLQREETELIKTLLGKDVYIEMAKETGAPDWTERMFGAISDEQRDKVNEMQQRFQEATSEIYAKADGYVDQETQADLKTLQRKFRDELTTVLTPQQIEEYELRSSDVANNMRYQLGPFEPNEKEFRSIFKYKQTLEDLNSARNPDDDSPRPSAEERKARQEKQKEFDDALAKALGPDRLKEYKILDDGAYRNLFESGAPKESILKVADMKQQTEDAAGRIRQDKTMTSEQRTEALKAIRAETEKELFKVLGERRGKAYSNNGGWWLRNIAPRE